jgi:hypothetical protein
MEQLNIQEEYVAVETFSESLIVYGPVCGKRDLEEQILKAVFFGCGTPLGHHYWAVEPRTDCGGKIRVGGSG